MGGQIVRVFIQFLFIISSVYCARETPSDLARTYSAENCAMLDHNKSVIMWTNAKLNAICKKTEFVHLIPTDGTSPIVIRRSQINIIEMEYDYILIAFYDLNDTAGNAKLHFESLAKALLFSNHMFPMSSSRKLGHVRRTAKIHRIAKDPPLHKTAEVYADVWIDTFSKKFIVKSDGQTYPSLVFSKGQYGITMTEKPGSQVMLELGDKYYIIYFNQVEDAVALGNRMSAFSKEGSVKKVSNLF